VSMWLRLFQGVSSSSRFHDLASVCGMRVVSLCFVSSLMEGAVSRPVHDGCTRARVRVCLVRFVFALEPSADCRCRRRDERAERESGVPSGPGRVSARREPFDA